MSDSRPENTDSPETTEAAEAAKKPFLRIVKGSPSDAQVAALTTVFAGLASAAAAAEKKEVDRNKWGNYAERLNRPTTYNPNAFRNVSFY